MIELAQDFDIQPNQIKQLHDRLFEEAAGVFGQAPKAAADPGIFAKTPRAKISDLTPEGVFCPALSGQAGLLARIRK